MSGKTSRAVGSAVCSTVPFVYDGPLALPSFANWGSFYLSQTYASVISDTHRDIFPRIAFNAYKNLAAE